MAPIRQSKPDSGLSFQVQVLQIFEAAPSSLGSGGVYGLEFSIWHISYKENTCEVRSQSLRFGV